MTTKEKNILDSVIYSYTTNATQSEEENRILKETVNKLKEELNFSYVQIGSGKYALDQSPVSTKCDCYTCKNHTKAYLHHLFKVGDPVAYRLATIHNLRFYSMLMEKLSNN